jgi:hypothetical protein
MINTTHVATRDETDLLCLWAECPAVAVAQGEIRMRPRVAGFVGYPNVGKSSTNQCV